ncbi:hypothetical protein KEM55_006654 [Ascosphaera atra]|nr:hypothetical protein KEM55_006654 [Ascosphaera atra]
MIHSATELVRMYVASQGINGIVSIGGSCGTAIAAAVMGDGAPVGFPKLIVSTVASGDVKAFVGNTDITMMYSVVDISGSNYILNKVLANAAGAIDGMVTANKKWFWKCWKEAEKEKEMGVQKKKKTVAVSMFGVTTPCVEMVRDRLEGKYGCEVIIFHATGAGGQAMERLISEGNIDAVADITTTEVPDEIAGGIFAAGTDRLTAAAKRGIPQIVSVGACDMVNFGPKNAVPEKYKGRLLHEHNPAITLMRTSEEECTKIGEFIARQLRDNVKEPKNVKVVIPAQGISLLATPGGPFHDAKADEALFTSVEDGLKETGIEVERAAMAVNDREFAEKVADDLMSFFS